jgi:peptide-methionine (R)-S-oxide reductase
MTYRSIALILIPTSIVILALFLIAPTGIAQDALSNAKGDLANSSGRAAPAPATAAPKKVIKTEREWQKLLSPAAYYVTRLKSTEPAFSGRLVNEHGVGTYTCVCCGAPLFSSRAKFNSGTGWPSFWMPYAAERIQTAPDYHASETRVEVMCSRCDAHLGHVFSDGPPPTGLRFCINSVSLKFVPEPKAKAKAKAKAKTVAPAPGTAPAPAPDSDPAATPDPAASPEVTSSSTPAPATVPALVPSPAPAPAPGSQPEGSANAKPAP